MGKLTAFLLVAAIAALASCGTDVPSEMGATTQAPVSSLEVRGGFEAGLVVGLVVPDAEPGGTIPLIVLVPGGGWATADPAGLRPLAEHLGGLSAAVALVTYRAGDDGVYFPDQPNDVGCAVNASAAAVRGAGFEVGGVTVVGHSSGAHLASLVALRPAAFSSRCRHPLVAPDRLVGLAGPYDVSRATRFAGNLFGPDNTNPDRWADGNPMTHARERPELDVLLIHGQSDAAVPMFFTDAFAAALENGGHNLTVIRPPGADHHSVYTPSAAGAHIAEWLNLPTPDR